MEIIDINGVQYTAEQVKELADKAALAEQLAQEKEGVVNEMKELRTKKQELEALLQEELKGKSTGTPDTAAIIREELSKVLGEERSKQIEMTRAEFEEKFKSSNPEFQPSNDVGGLKWNAFKATLNRFNLSGLTRESDFESVYKDAMRLTKDSKPASPSNNPYAFSPASRSSSASSVPENDISFEEQKVIDGLGWTKEKYLKIKASQPGLIRGLFKN